jgi:hypothetical protein
MSWVLQHAQVCVVSLGARGCVARSRTGAQGSSLAAGIKVVDTIGAGDHFAAGFLFAHLLGCSIDKACAAGCAAGSAAVQEQGAELPRDAWDRLCTKMDSIVGSEAAGGKGAGSGMENGNGMENGGGAKAGQHCSNGWGSHRSNGGLGVGGSKVGAAVNTGVADGSLLQGDSNQHQLQDAAHINADAGRVLLPA